MEKILIIGGPTATGKTNIALEIAKNNNGELINADSRQVYKYLDIGTNKGKIKQINKNEFLIEKIPIHLINLITPDKRFNVFEWRQLARKSIKEISLRGKLPILVGGTGLYIDSIIKNYNLNEEQDLELRNKLEQLNINELQKQLNKIDHQKFESLNQSDRNNPRRLIRLIEKAESGSIVNQSEKDIFSNDTLHEYDYLFLYPEYDWNKLKIKIENRVEQMFKDGLIEETKKILELGYKKDDPGLQIMGYKQAVEYLEGRISLEKCVELVKFAHKQYAKRQRTWFEGIGRNYHLTKVTSI